MLLSSCGAIMGEEIGRLPINKISTDEENLIIKEISLDLKKGDKIDFWSEIDLESEGDLALEFRVRMYKDGEELEMFEVFPFKGNITMNEKKIQKNDELDWSFSKKNTSKMIKEDGKYTFAAILLSNNNDKLNLNKAELVIRKKK